MTMAIRTRENNVCLKKKTTALQVNNTFFSLPSTTYMYNFLTFYVIENLTTRTMNFLSRFRLPLIVFIDKLSEAK